MSLTRQFTYTVPVYVSLDYPKSVYISHNLICTNLPCWINFLHGSFCLPLCTHAYRKSFTRTYYHVNALYPFHETPILRKSLF